MPCHPRSGVFSVAYERMGVLQPCSGYGINKLRQTGNFNQSGLSPSIPAKASNNKPWQSALSTPLEHVDLLRQQRNDKENSGMICYKFSSKALQIFMFSKVVPERSSSERVSSSVAPGAAIMKGAADDARRMQSVTVLAQKRPTSGNR